MKRLRELRESRNLNQQYVASYVSVSQTMISKYELGQAEPDIQTIIKLAGFFRVSVDYLLGLSDNKLNVSSDGLSAAERDILFNFKRLNEVQKAKAQAYIQGLLQD